MNELVSVIIPVYNHASGLKMSLFSLSKQTYKPLETIIVNDGSTDQLKMVIEEMKNEVWWKDLNPKFIDQENRGASAARNRGFRESNGKYVLFWDADTIGEPRMIEKMVSVLQQRTEASYVYSQFRFGWKKMKSREFSPEMLRKVNYVDTTSLVRREAVVAFDENLKRFQDWDVWLTLLEKGQTGIFIPEVLFKKMVKGRKGISTWLPSFVFKLPLKTAGIINYEAAKKLVVQKHHLS